MKICMHIFLQLNNPTGVSIFYKLHSVCFLGQERAYTTLYVTSPPWLCGCRVEEEFVTIKPVHHMLPRSREIVIFCLSICISPGLGHLGQLMRSYKCFHLHLQTLLPAVTPLCLNPKYVVRSCSRAFLCLCDGWYMQQFFTKRTTIVTTDALCKSALRYCHGLLLLSF